MRLTFRTGGPDAFVEGRDADDIVQQWNEDGWWSHLSPDAFVLKQAQVYGARGVTESTGNLDFLRAIAAADPVHLELDEDHGPSAAWSARRLAERA